MLTIPIVAVFAIVLGALVVAGRPPASQRSAGDASRATALWLAAVAAALILVGIVSGTLLRHVVQIAPLVVAMALAWRRSRLGASAAAPLFAFWLLLMGVIWLFLLNIARLISGTFTSTEIVLTVVIGVAAALGLAAAWRARGLAGPLPSLAVVVGFALLQFAAMLLSFQPFIAHR